MVKANILFSRKAAFIKSYTFYTILLVDYFWSITNRYFYVSDNLIYVVRIVQSCGVSVRQSDLSTTLEHVCHR